MEPSRSSPLAVWTLDHDANRRAALQCRDINDLDRFEPFDGSPMAHVWESVRMFWETEDGSRPRSDFARAGGAPAFNGRSLDALSDLLEGRGELLPLDVEDADEEYYAFNCTRLSDALDEQRSEFAYFPDGGILDIDRYQFLSQQLAAETIFKLAAVRRVYHYVTDTFRQRVEQTGLTGFRWERPVWQAPGSLDPEGRT